MKVAFFANTDWYLFNFRLSFAKYLRSHGIDVIFISPPGDYFQYLEEAGFRYAPVPMKRISYVPFREIGLILHIARLLKTECVDLLHNFTIKCVIYGSIAGRLSGKPQINAIDGVGYVFSSQELKAKLIKLPLCIMLRIVLFDGENRLILQNSDNVSLFHELQLMNKNRIRLIRSVGVDTDRFRPQNCPTGGDRGVLRILLAARLIWEKGIREFVEAAEILRKRGKKYEFVLAGAPDPGNPASIPLDVLDRWKREGQVSMLGHVHDMKALLRSVDVVTLPSAYGEGIPVSLLEAASCGLPLITTNIAGCREVVEGGINGLLIPCRNANRLADAIAYLGDRPTERQRMGRESRRKVLEEFDERLVFKKTLAVYKELFRSNTRSTANPEKGLL